MFSENIRNLSAVVMSVLWWNKFIPQSEVVSKVHCATFSGVMEVLEYLQDRKMVMREIALNESTNNWEPHWKKI